MSIAVGILLKPHHARSVLELPLSYTLQLPWKMRARQRTGSEDSMEDARQPEPSPLEESDRLAPDSIGGGDPLRAGKREVDLYVRTYMTLLRSSGPIAVDALVQAHINSGSSLHAGATDATPDMSAFMYSTLRLPPEIISVRRILLGQSRSIFARNGYADLESWSSVSAPGRRRRWHYDGDQTLAVYVGSTSDLDDLIPTIVAWQIEWNKLHILARHNEQLKAHIAEAVSDASPASAASEAVREGLGIDPNDWQRLSLAWGADFWPNLQHMATQKRDIDLQMLGGTYLGYARSTAHWWAPVERLLVRRELTDRPLYFVSSNTHSIANVLSGTARRRRERLVAFIEQSQHPDLLPELRQLQSGGSKASWDNFLYYAARIYYKLHPDERAARDREEEQRGITTLETESVLDVGVQVIELNKLDPADLDPRIAATDGSLPDSDAIIINVNYPLGLAAYHIFTQLAVATERLRGVYILGKAATLNARIGDVMISDSVYDEHSGNTYWFHNRFSSADLDPFLVYGSALDHQRAVTVKGTYLQNRGYLDFYYRENYTVVEMEAGPYLSALYEDTFMTHHPQDQNVNLTDIPVDVGIIHYASDTPYTRAQTLGARGLSYYGMDSTYASTLAILNRVFEQCR